MSMMSTHDYDHDREISALFDTRAAAEKVKADIAAAGLPAAAVSITEGHSGVTTGSAAKADEGFWGSLKTLFAPEEDRYAYAEGLRRGGFLLTAYTSEAHYDRVLHIIDTEGAVDLHERETEWRKEGWTGHQGGTSTAAAGAAVTSTAATAETGLVGHTGSTSTTPGVERGALATGGGALGEETIQLAEERLRVGKRDVNHGRVRLRSYVVEKPVSEQVSLRSERVDVSRRAVDRPLAAGENLFQERTLSAEEHEEEAVVSKEARVVEEISLGKVAQERTQEIRDTVRRTEVEVQDERTGHAAGATAARPVGLMGETRGTAATIVEHMEVRSSDGTHVGTVDHLDGTDRIKLTKTDTADGQHHFIPRSWVDHVDQHVHLNKSAAAVHAGWTLA